MRALLCAVLLLVVGPGSAEAGIKTLSTRPEMVTGGDVLVRVPRDATVHVNGRIEPGRGETRLLDGLALGRNTITADGARCDLYDHAINIWGRDPDTGFARRPLDNVGIQYGLKALRSGAITPDQFLDLNEHVGGFDADANLVPQRTVADPVAVRRAYRTGRVTNGGLGLKHIPIIDYRAYNDDAVNGDIHVRYHSFSMRARLRKANGTARNQVMLVEDQRYGLYSTESPLLQHAILALDRWLTSGKKPQEGCMTRDASPTFIAERQARDLRTRCEQLYPSASFPREVAGEDVAADIVKCTLKPIDPADYRGRLSATQLGRLRAIFPTGVCDWSRPGVGQQPPRGTWLSFGPP